ncbi:hypothetical protein EI94DRAFT_1785011 [Lactarius quietus]|nr:hypothetical protein EI94DRAFT_1785011 [Lactarius quietus]
MSVINGATEILVRAQSVPLYLEAMASSRRWDNAQYITLTKELQACLLAYATLTLAQNPTASAVHSDDLCHLLPPSNIFQSFPSENSNTPRLSCLKLRYCNINWKSLLLKRLKYLEILRPGENARPKLAFWLGALAEMPELKNLTPQSASPIAAIPPSDVERTVTLSSLTYLNIEAWLEDYILAWPVPDIGVEGQEPATLLGATLPPRLALSFNSDDEHLSKELVPMLTSRPTSRNYRYREIRNEAILAPYLANFPLASACGSGASFGVWIIEMLLEDNEGCEPLLPSLTELVVVDYSIPEVSSLFRNALMKRVEQGVPLEVLTCLRLLNEIVVDVLVPEKFKAREQMAFMWKRVPLGIFIDDDHREDTESEATGSYHGDKVTTKNRWLRGDTGRRGKIFPDFNAEKPTRCLCFLCVTVTAINTKVWRNIHGPGGVLADFVKMIVLAAQHVFVVFPLASCVRGREHVHDTEKGNKGMVRNERAPRSNVEETRPTNKPKEDGTAASEGKQSKARIRNCTALRFSKQERNVNQRGVLTSEMAAS